MRRDPSVPPPVKDPWTGYPRVKLEDVARYSWDEPVGTYIHVPTGRLYYPAISEHGGARTMLGEESYRDAAAAAEVARAVVERLPFGAYLGPRLAFDLDAIVKDRMSGGKYSWRHKLGDEAAHLGNIVASVLRGAHQRGVLRLDDKTYGGQGLRDIAAKKIGPAMTAYVEAAVQRAAADKDAAVAAARAALKSAASGRRRGKAGGAATEPTITVAAFRKFAKPGGKDPFTGSPWWQPAHGLTSFFPTVACATDGYRLAILRSSAVPLDPHLPASAIFRLAESVPGSTKFWAADHMDYLERSFDEPPPVLDLVSDNLGKTWTDGETYTIWDNATCKAIIEAAPDSVNDGTVEGRTKYANRVGIVFDHRGVVIIGWDPDTHGAKKEILRIGERPTTVAGGRFGGSTRGMNAFFVAEALRALLSDEPAGSVVICGGARMHALTPHFFRLASQSYVGGGLDPMKITQLHVLMPLRLD